MNRNELALRLVAAEGEAARAALLREHHALADVSLAYALKEICYESWATEPTRAHAAAANLKTLEGLTQDPEVSAVAAWVAGISALTSGEMGRAIEHLDAAESRFVALGQLHAAASTQVSKVYALAVLGRYDEAIGTGLRAREVFVAHGDLPAAGRVEHNIGNICWRRDRYQEAEHYLKLARERFLGTDDHQQLAMIENSMAGNYTFQQDFRSAERLYEQAYERAARAGLAVTQAEIEANMGNFALFQGRYDRALDMLERSRRRYASLGMPHQSAVAEMELADAYLELNLATEASVIYERVAPTFASLGMRAEQARALAQRGRAALALGRSGEAHRFLEEARALYAAEGNTVGEAYVTLAEAQLRHAEGDFAATAVLAAQAEAPLAEAGAWRRLLVARWLRGEAARAQGQERLAQILLEGTLRDAEAQALPQVAERCHTSLGLLAVAGGDAERAEGFFSRAVALTETIRAPLPAEEFRTAFVADRLAAYDELVRLCLADASGGRVEEALCYVERARSRALFEMLSGTLSVRPRPRDEFEAGLLARLEELREELNWLYNQINRPPEVGVARSPSTMDALHATAREREARMLEITRQIQQRSDEGGGHGDASGPAGVFAFNHTQPLDLGALRRDLGRDTALVEYTSLGEELLAFVVTDEGIEVVRNLSTVGELNEALAQFRFQIDGLRYGSGAMRAHLGSLTARARHHLGRLYDLLLRRVEEALRAFEEGGGTRRLVVVPHRALHYVPFHALHDGEAYLVERREVSYAPSAGVLRHCLDRPRSSFGRALLVGVADDLTPRVREEVASLAPLFTEATVLLDEDATLSGLRARAPAAEVLHLACHGEFRPDNPLFSSLRLADGWLTVRDAYALDFGGGLVTLSACETGVSAVAPGDELIGLVRGFFSTGAPTLLLSLWTVDDEATAELMRDFYAHLLAGERPAAALRAAQLSQMKKQPHPFFWSPFMLTGRW
ncbi:MAG TPA: CHAT domain-containing protein [Pyrinomonadaceae bacterium]|nr:CHAT domain-containing protein [Pyrinomonadaceae bacterium]